MPTPTTTPAEPQPGGPDALPQEDSQLVRDLRQTVPAAEKSSDSVVDDSLTEVLPDEHIAEDGLSVDQPLTEPSDPE